MTRLRRPIVIEHVRPAVDDGRYPVKRVTGYDVVMPLPKLEGQYLPDAERIIDAVRQVMEAQ